MVECWSSKPRVRVQSSLHAPRQDGGIGRRIEFKPRRAYP
nr:MAG TPA: hypothetical protein [Caudoviricetes sp.]